MSGDNNVKQFPHHRTSSPLGMPMQAATFESELDPGNPFRDSLRALLTKRRDLIEKYSSSDGSVREVEHQIAERVAALAGEE